MRFALSVLFCLVLCGAAGAQRVADRVYGQPDFNSNIPGSELMPWNARLYHPTGVAPTADGVYICDTTYNRVLYFPSQSSEATRVYGQPDFTSTDANNGGISATSLNGPFGIAAGADGLYVADQANHRVLFFPNGQTTATRVYGQPDFTTSRVNYPDMTTGMYMPEQLAVDPDGGLYVSDSGNNRVLYFPRGQTTPTRVYGQPDFRTNVGGLGPAHLLYPKGVGATSEGVYVTDRGNERVLFFPLQGGPATRVWGQPDFWSDAPSNPGCGPNSFQDPNGLATDEDGFYVSDYLGSRVLFFPYGSQVATVVYGETDFTTVRMYFGGVTDHGFYVPWNVAAGYGFVYVCDTHNGRVLRFPKDTSPMPYSIEFDRQPVGAPAGQPLSTQPRVVVRFTTGAVANTYNGTVEVRLKPGTGPACARLHGTTTMNAVNGVAAFTDLSIDTPGTYTLTALTATLPIPWSQDVVVTAPPGAHWPGDVNGDGQFNLADVAVTMRYLAGLEAMPQ